MTASARACVPSLLVLVLAFPGLARNQPESDEAPRPVGGLPPPPPPMAAPLSLEEAQSLAVSLFGCSVSALEEGDREYRVRVEECALPCPLERVRGTRCGQFRWEPHEVRLYRASHVAAVSGHLARNRLVVVDMSSSSAGLAYGALHGVLVFPSPAADPSSRPAFAWYLTRLGRTLGLEMRDMNSDGLVDLIYTYSSLQIGGVRLVSRDVWTVSDLHADRLISSGDALPGVALGAFDGVPLHRDRDDGFERGAWRIEVLDRARPPLLLVERATFPSVSGPDWEFQVVADLGEGWTEFLSGAPEFGHKDMLHVDGSPSGTCSPAEAPAGLGLGVRKRLIALESACRALRTASGVFAGSPWADAALWLLGAWWASAEGMAVVGLAFESAAAHALLSARPAALSWPVSLALSLHLVWATHRLAAHAYDPRFSDPPDWTEAEAFPALAPITGPMFRLVAPARRWFISPTAAR